MNRQFHLQAIALIALSVSTLQAQDERVDLRRSSQFETLNTRVGHLSQTLKNWTTQIDSSVYGQSVIDAADGIVQLLQAELKNAKTESARSGIKLLKDHMLAVVERVGQAHLTAVSSKTLPQEVAAGFAEGVQKDAKLAAAIAGGARLLLDADARDRIVTSMDLSLTEFYEQWHDLGGIATGGNAVTPRKVDPLLDEARRLDDGKQAVLVASNGEKDILVSDYAGTSRSMPVDTAVTILYGWHGPMKQIKLGDGTKCIVHVSNLKVLK